MDLKIQVYAADGRELVPCSFDKAKELCDKKKAEAIKGGTAIRLLVTTEDRINREKQLQALLTSKMIFEHQLRKITIVGGPASGKSHSILQILQALPGISQTTQSRIGVAVYVYQHEKLMQGHFANLQERYQETVVTSTRSFISLDRDEVGTYSINRNDRHPGSGVVQSRLLTIIPLRNTDFGNEVATKVASWAKGNYALLLDGVAEPTTPSYMKMKEDAVLTVVTRLPMETEEDALQVEYR